jgi:hypothetical protein
MQYITFKRGGEGSLGTVTSCIDASVRTVTKSPKVGPLQSTYILHLSAHLIEPPEIVPVGGVVEGGGGHRRLRRAEGFLRSISTVHTSTDM